MLRADQRHVEIGYIGGYMEHMPASCWLCDQLADSLPPWTATGSAINVADFPNVKSHAKD